MKKIYIIIAIIIPLWILSACQNPTSFHTIDIQVEADEHIDLMIYEDETLDQVLNSHTIQFRVDNNINALDQSVSLYLKINTQSGYELDTIKMGDTVINYQLINEESSIYTITIPIQQSQIWISSKTIEEDIVNNDTFEGTFVLDEHVSILIYPTQVLENGESNLIGIAKDGTTGEVLTSGEGQINFSVILDEGYEIHTISITPNLYKNLKLPAELGDNTYRITKITGDIVITITTIQIDGAYNANEATTIQFTETGIVIRNNNGYVTLQNDLVIITSGGHYVIYGQSSEGSVQVNAADANIDLEFGELTLSSTLNAPIQIIKANKVNIFIPFGITVTLNDLRSTQLSESDDTPNAALYANADLNLSGSGLLIVNASYNNGIGTKDDLTIEGLNITVESANHAIKGSDSITILSGTYHLTAQGGDGLKTTKSDISSKGNQRGTITLSGGEFIIHASTDGIDAAYDVIIENNPTITIFTTKTYTTSVGNPIENTASKLYIRIQSNVYSVNDRYAVYLENTDSSSSIWLNATMMGLVNMSGRNYYIYEITLDSSFEYFSIYRFNAASINSTTSYISKSEKAKLNDNYNMVSLTISGTNITYGFSIYTSSSLEYSSKGIKADNEIVISGGVITIQSYDDAIHANGDVLLENGIYGLGNVSIDGGSIVITTKDDGIHADKTVHISGGSIEILTSYEGIEGNVVKVSGGVIKVNSTDDGVNATAGTLASKVEVTGGYLEISVGTGDTDAIDSNGTYVQTGGFVVSMSALSGGMGGALDTDGSVSVTGGTFIGIGSSERIPTTSGNNRSTGSMTISITPGLYTIKDASGNTIISFTTTTYTYNKIFISSDQLKQGTNYTLYRGTTSLKIWTQA